MSQAVVFCLLSIIINRKGYTWQIQGLGLLAVPVILCQWLELTALFGLSSALCHSAASARIQECKTRNRDWTGLHLMS